MPPRWDPKPIRSHDLPRGIVVHGYDERKDEHVDETDEGDRLRHGLGVRTQIDHGKVDRVGDGSGRLGEEVHRRGVTRVARDATGGVSGARGAVRLECRTESSRMRLGLCRGWFHPTYYCPID
jgi:hypothetical protein